MHRRLLAVVALAAILACPSVAGAEWQLKPFVGVKFGTSTTFIDADRATGSAKMVIGGSGAYVGELLGVEADFGRVGGFFQSGRGGNVLGSSVSTLTGNVTVALPRRLTEYTLRPYFVGGAGVMLVRMDQKATTFDVSENMPTFDVGGGVTGFLTRRIGLNWDVRHFRTIRGRAEGVGLSIGGGEQLSFWRANMALAIRY
jgi:hypothetical protein